MNQENTAFTLDTESWEDLPDDALGKVVEAVAERLLDELTDELDGISRPHEDDNTLLDVHDVAHRLQVSKRKVENFISQGLIKPIWIGYQRRFTEEAIEAFIQRCVESDRDVPS